MAASKKANKNTISKSKAVEKAITRLSSNRPRHNGRYVAATSSIRDTRSDPIEETSPGYLQQVRCALEDLVAEYKRDERPDQYRVHKSFTHLHHRHRYSSESSPDSEEGDGPAKSSRDSKAETRIHRAAELGVDPPSSWYGQTDLSHEAARALWWGLDAKTQKIYAAVEISYSSHCLINRIKRPFPVTVNSLASWIMDLGRKRANSATIKSHLNRVRSLNVDMGYDDRAFDSPQLDIIIAGYCRLRGVS